MKAPTLELEWELGLFKALRSLWRKVAPEPPSKWDEGRVAHLEDHQGPLTVLAQVIAGFPVRVQPARDIGGVRGRDLLLPPWLDMAPDPQANRGLYVVRTAVSAAMFRVAPQFVSGAPWEQALADLETAHRAVQWLIEELPNFAGAHESAMALELRCRPTLDGLGPQEALIEGARRAALGGGYPWDDADLRVALSTARSGGLTSPGIRIWGRPIAVAIGLDKTDEASKDEPGTRPPPSSEAVAPAVEDIHEVKLSEKDQEMSAIMHTFEKVETAESYSGGARDADGADELDDHLEALQEVDFDTVIRGGDPAHSLLRADIQLSSDVPDVGDVIPGEVGIPYDEWDRRRNAYRPDWCTVYPTQMGAGNPSWGAEAAARHRRSIDTLRRRLEAHRTERRPKNRQLDGEDVDIAALIDEHSARLAGHGGSQRLYVRRAKANRSFATTVLLDVSLSTDAWVGNRRVLDVSREAVLVLGEVVASLGDQIQVLAFASHTRNRCRVWEVLGFGGAWASGRSRLGVLKPQGYTRIGPAIRHGIAELGKVEADRRLLLLISDGKPTDYDRYEGRYGIADVRQALREAGQAGVSAHALAVDVTARDHLPAMFGPGAWHILPRPEALPEALATVYGRLTSS